MFTKELISKGTSIIEDCCRTLLRHLTMPAMYFKEAGITITTKSNPTGLPPKSESTMAMTMMMQPNSSINQVNDSVSVVATKEPYGGGGNRLQVLYVVLLCNYKASKQPIKQSITDIIYIHTYIHTTYLYTVSYTHLTLPTNREV